MGVTILFKVKKVEEPIIVKRIKALDAVPISDYHGYDYSRPDVGRGLLFGIELEFDVSEEIGKKVIHFFLQDLAHAEHDGSVDIEYPTDPIQFTQHNVKKVIRRVRRILKTSEQYFGGAVYIGHNCGTHIHISIPKGNEFMGTALALKFVRSVQTYLLNHPMMLKALLGRQFNSYAYKFSSDMSVPDWYHYRKVWVNISYLSKGIEYRLPVYKDGIQFYHAVLFLRSLHKAILFMGNQKIANYIKVREFHKMFDKVKEDFVKQYKLMKKEKKEKKL